MSSLATIGYEGVAIDALVRALKSARVRRLIDVRDLPLSRKKGFSKSALSERLEQEGIQYLHIKALGDPKPGRLAAREGNFARFKKIYTNHLRSKKARDALAQLGLITSRGKSCLLCYEYDPMNCHRQIVASRLCRSYGLSVEHLKANVPMKRPSHVARRTARGSVRSGEGAAAP